MSDRLAGPREPHNVRSLVFEAACAQNIQHRVVKEGAFDDLVCGQPLEVCQVATPEEIGQVGGVVGWAIVANVHASVPEYQCSANDRLTLNLESTCVSGLNCPYLYARTWERIFDVNVKELTFRASLHELLEDGLRHIVILVYSTVLELDLKSLSGRIVTDRYDS